MIEFLKLIKGYKDYYISNLGEVYSTKGKTMKKLKKRTNCGYYTVNLSQNSITKDFRVHRLVAEYFIDNPNNLESVDHINKDRKDNRIENLQWLSLADNTTKELKDNGKHSFNEEEIRWIREHYKKGDKEYGAKPLARKFNVDNHCIRLIINRVHYKWVA